MRAPHALARALAATVVLAGGLVLFTREVPLWALLPAVAAAQLGLHESFGLVVERGHALSLAYPASAHVGATVTDASAGAFTVLTLSVPHGCEDSPTIRIEMQVPESVFSVTPTRNPYYDLETTIEQLDEPITDARGNQFTERRPPSPTTTAPRPSARPSARSAGLARSRRR